MFVKEEESGDTELQIFTDLSTCCAVHLGHHLYCSSGETLEQELSHFGKTASGLMTVNLGCKSDKLKRVHSFRQQYIPECPLTDYRCVL